MAEPDVADFLASRGIDLVFDVGANTGQYGAWLRERGYRGRIVSFEPVDEVFAELASRAAADPLWDVHRCGLGARAGQATIHVSRWSVFSSLLPSRPAARVFDDNAEVTREASVVIRTLDEVAADLAPARPFLKIDTQGYEREVLAGAPSTLPRLLGVQVEVPVIHLYEGAWTMQDALSTLAGSGFVLSLVSTVNHHSRDPCAVVELDCVFRRRSDID